MTSSIKDTSCGDLPRKLVYSAAELCEAPRLAVGKALAIYKVDETTVVKTSDPARLAEGITMEFVRERTSIPVPKLHNMYIDKDLDRSFMVMEFVEGDVLGDVWDDFTPDQKGEIISQLAGYVAELRTIKGNFIGSVDHTYCEDPFFTDDLGGFGPFESEKAFHENGLIRAMNLAVTISGRSDIDGYLGMVSDMISALPSHPIVFTHSDLSPRNILVKEGRVVAVLDWELAGFYPAYWEYVKALFRPDWQSGWIKDKAVDKIMHPYPLEHAVMLATRDIVW